MKNLKKFIKPISIVLFSVALIAFVCVAATRKPYRPKYEDIVLADDYTSKVVTLNIGEKYDLSDAVKNASERIDKKLWLASDSYFSMSSENENVEISGKKVKAVKGGFCRIYLRFEYVGYHPINAPDLAAGVNILLDTISFIVMSDDAVPVYSLSDITDQNTTFVLKNDITVSEPLSQNGDFIIDVFRGVLLNPDGYAINIEDGANAQYFIRRNYGALIGLKLNFSTNTENKSFSGLSRTSSGLLQDCDISCTVYASVLNISLGSCYNTSYSVICFSNADEKFVFWNIYVDETTDSSISVILLGDNISAESFTKAVGNNSTYELKVNPTEEIPSVE